MKQYKMLNDARKREVNRRESIKATFAANRKTIH